MKKAVIIGIIAIVIIVGAVSILSINAIFLINGSESTSKDSEKAGSESKPVGRNFSIELEEKMGFANP